MNVFAIILPIIFVTFTGYLCTRLNYVSREQVNGLSKLTFNILMPSFLFVTMATTKLSELFDIKVMAAFYLPVLSIYALTMAYHFYLANNERKKIGAAAVFAMGNTYSNVVLLGLPVIFSALGEQYAAYVFLVLSVHGLVMIGFTSFCGSFDNQQQNSNDSKLLTLGKKLGNMLSNPVLASIFGGMLYNLAGFGLEPTLAASLHLLGKPGISCALLILGSSLHYYSVKGKIGQIATLTLVKLVLLPLSVYFSATYLFELEPVLVAVVVLLAASPTGVNAYLVACTVNQHQALVASTVVVTTVMCMFTISGWLLFLL